MDFNQYSKIIIAFSGGKDSLACLLHLLNMGVERDLLELWHHDVDGSGGNFMDWSCTSSYCKAIAPERFEKIATYERLFSTTINRTQDVVALANKGTAYAATENLALVQEAFAPNWDYPVFVEDWQLPSGAFGELTGPS